MDTATFTRDDVARSLASLAASMHATVDSITDDAARAAVASATDVLSALAFTLHAMDAAPLDGERIGAGYL